MDLEMPEPRVFYPLTFDYQGHDLTGRQSSIMFNGISIQSSNSKLGGVLRLENSDGKNAQINTEDGTLTFMVS